MFNLSLVSLNDINKNKLFKKVKMSSTKYNVLIMATTKEDLASFSKIKKAHAGC
jgi:hypothetical protein